MIRKLIVVGDEVAIVLDRSMLDRLDIDEQTSLEVTAEGDAVVVRAVRDAHPDEVAESASRMMDRHEQTFRDLAK